MELIARLLGEFEFVVADQERRAYPAIGGFHLDEALMGVLFERQDVEPRTVSLGVGHPIQPLKKLWVAELGQALLFVANHPLLPCPAQLAVGFIASGIIELSR
ncbi:hypothetical+protein [Escherichia coli]|uniref:Uncharacterized protein n=1 Tax=Escherichia coli TaxID=562 RepID=A0A144A580_ECOLX|nr:hypothetical protein pSH11sh418-1_00067 [Shigella sonnei]CAA0304984.1 hypothetical+protein [Escherichia coli]CZU15727.1 Uncharacterised protein [Escherichia coli]VUJ24855.1 Uncharacterised protein [Klebsiella pneumoniae]